MTVPQSNPILAAALAYAARGWQVFPCSPNDKRPLVPGESAKGAHDGGCWLATTDASQIEAWWRRWPKAMIGVRMGTGSGAIAFDVDCYKADPKTGELRSFDEWVAAIEEEISARLPPTLVSETPRGGRHLLYAPPEGFALDGLGNSRGALPGIVDVRGDGGYIIVGPSVRLGNKAEDEGCEGKAYFWLDAAVPVATGPRELFECITRTGKFARVSAPHPTSSGAPLPPSTGSAEDEAVRRYGLTALDNAVGKVSAAGPGTRNETLNKVALGIGHLVGAGALSRTMAHAALYSAACSWGIGGEDKALRPGGTLDRALDDGARDPTDLSEVRRNARERAERKARFDARAGGGARLRTEEPPPWEPDAAMSALPEDFGAPVSPAPSSSAPLQPPHVPSLEGGSELGGRLPPGGAGGLDFECSRLPATDLGNAKRFLARHGRDFLFVREWGWLAWDGRRWRREGAEDRAEAKIKATIEAIGDEVEALRRSGADVVVGRKRSGEDVRASDELADWALKSQAAGHINCLIGLVQSDLARVPSDFDADPMRINVLNGTISVAKSEDDPYVRLLPHDRADLITKLAPVEYDPAATCPLFDRFSVEVQPSATARRFLDQWFGLGLTGDASEQKMLFLLGKGRNGKSVWVDAVAHVLGEYGDTVPIETFVDQGKGRAAGAPTPDLALLSGVRMLRTSEPKKGAHLDEALIKLVTGGETLRVRELNKGYFVLRVQFKMTIQSNYRPKIDGTDEGIWGRFILVPFPVFIPPERRDLKLGEKLRAEASGILNRLLSGLCDWLDNGLVVPNDIVDATVQFRTDSDPLGRWLAECTRSTIGARTQATDAVDSFNAWGRAEDIAWSAKGFSNAMVDRGFTKIKSGGVIQWLDLELTRDKWSFGVPDEQGDPGP